MAYKFQLGSFTASGSIKAESGFDAGDSNVTNVGDIALDSISADGTDMSISLSDNAAGALEIAEGGTIYMAFDTTNDSEVIQVGKKMQIMDDTKLVFGTNSDASFEYDEDDQDVLLYAGANLRIGDDIKIEFGAAGDAGIEYDENGTDQLRIHAPAAGVVIAGTSPSLTIGDAGAEDTKIVFDGNAQDFYIGLDDTDDDLKIGLGSTVGSSTAITLNGDANATFAGNVTVAGNFTVQGTTTSVDSTTINISSSFTFEGPADDHETILTCGTPTADTTITLPQIAAGTYHVAVLADATTAAAAAVTAAEFALLDGGTARGTSALASGDGFLHNDGGVMKMTSIDKIGDFLAGDGLAVSSGVLAVGVDDTGIEINSDALRLKDNGVTLAKMAGLSRGSFIIGDSSGDPSALSLGTNAQILVSDGSDLAYVSLSGDVTIANNGATTIGANAVEGSMLNNNIVSGLDDIGAAIADTDEMIISDAGTIKRMDMSRIKTYIGPGTVTVTSFGDADATLAVGVNYATANPSTDRTLTLPASAGLSAGQSIKVKAPADLTNGNLIIARAGSQTIDGATSITLESPFAAVELVYVAADTWRVF